MNPKSAINASTRGLSEHVPGAHDSVLYKEVRKRLEFCSEKTSENIEWLFHNMHFYFFITMIEEVEAIVQLASRLQDVATEAKVTLIDQEKKLILALLDVPGSIYATLKTLQERRISYVEMSHSYNVIPDVGKYLEIQRYEFESGSHAEITRERRIAIPSWIHKKVLKSMKDLYPVFDLKEFDKVLELLWLNNQSYIRISPPERIARVMWGKNMTVFFSTWKQRMMKGIIRSPGSSSP